MNKIMMIILAFLTLLGCRTRKVETTQQKQVQKERIIKYKDSSQVLNFQVQKSDIHELSDASFSIELESDKDSLGYAKELIYYRIRDGEGETIKVSGGKVKLIQQSSVSNSQIVANASLTSTATITNDERRTAESVTAFSHKTKDVKGIQGWWLWVLIALLALSVYMYRKRFI